MRDGRVEALALARQAEVLTREAARHHVHLRRENRLPLSLSLHEIDHAVEVIDRRIDAEAPHVAQPSKACGGKDIACEDRAETIALEEHPLRIEGLLNPLGVAH